MAAQKDGCYPRLNGAMIQSQQYNGMVASVVGKLINSTTLQAADGTNLTLGTDYLQDGLVNNPDMCVEIIGQVVDATSMTAFVARELSTDMDLDLYNQMLAVQHSPGSSQYFPKVTAGASN